MEHTICQLIQDVLGAQANSFEQRLQDTPLHRSKQHTHLHETKGRWRPGRIEAETEHFDNLASIWKTLMAEKIKMGWLQTGWALLPWERAIERHHQDNFPLCGEAICLDGSSLHLRQHGSGWSLTHYTEREATQNDELLQEVRYYVRPKVGNNLAGDPAHDLGAETIIYQVAYRPEAGTNTKNPGQLRAYASRIKELGSPKERRR